MKRLLALAICGWLLALSAPALAGSAYIGINLVLRSGPDIGYPPVMTLPAGTYVEVHGCLSDYTWCDVEIQAWRGWVAGTYLQSYYNGGWVYLPAYGPRIGVPVVTFVIGTYWDRHYRHTSWYRERLRYERAPPRSLPPPRRTPNFRPRIPPPRHPAPPLNRHPVTTRPAPTRHALPSQRPLPPARPMPRSGTTPPRKPVRTNDKGGGGH